MPTRKKEKFCKDRLICPYNHESDEDCGKEGKKIVLDKKLITDYYKSLMVNYERSIDNENNKLKEIEKKYLCYICGEKHANALNIGVFYVDINKNKIVCIKCAKKNHIKTIEVRW